MRSLRVSQGRSSRSSRRRGGRAADPRQRIQPRRSSGHVSGETRAGWARSRRTPMSSAADEVARHRDDGPEQADQGPLGLHATDVDREERRHERQDPAPVVRPARRSSLRQALAETEQLGMIREAERPDHVGPGLPRVCTGVVTMFQPAPKMRSAPARAPVHVARGPPQHEEKRRHRQVAERRRGRASPSCGGLRSPPQLDGALEAVDEERRGEQQRQRGADQQRGGEDQQSHQDGQTGARVRRALRRAWLTRRKLCRPRARRRRSAARRRAAARRDRAASGAAAANPARTRATVPSPSRSRCMARHHYGQSSRSSIRPRSHGRTARRKPALPLTLIIGSAILPAHTESASPGQRRTGRARHEAW